MSIYPVERGKPLLESLASERQPREDPIPDFLIPAARARARTRIVHVPDVAPIHAERTIFRLDSESRERGRMRFPGIALGRNYAAQPSPVSRGGTTFDP